MVAKCIMRPPSMNEFHVQVRRGLILYNALGLYENNYNQLKQYMEFKHSLKFLAYTPTIFKSSTNESKNTYGLRMTKDVKPEAEIYLRDWLVEEVEEGKMNLHFILCKKVLKELIKYNDTGNFDAAIGLMLVIVQRIVMLRVLLKKKEEEINKFFERKLFVRNKYAYGR